jgi:hypothetical protein
VAVAAKVANRRTATEIEAVLPMLSADIMLALLAQMKDYLARPIYEIKQHDPAMPQHGLSD